jgi:hypothetical protein
MKQVMSTEKIWMDLVSFFEFDWKFELKIVFDVISKI